MARCFLVGLMVVLVFQLLAGIRLINHHGAYETISILVVVCFLIGISRSWELIGGPSIGIFHEVFTFGRTHTRVGAALSGAHDEPSDAGESEDGLRRPLRTRAGRADRDRVSQRGR